MPNVIDLPTATSMDSDDYFIMEESTGGTKKITSRNTVNVVYVANSEMSLPSGSTYTTIGSLSLTPGVWVITGQFTCPAAANFEVNASISTSSSQGQAREGGYVQIQATATIPRIAANMCRIISISSSQTIYLIARQYSGASITLAEGYCMMRAVRIA